MCSNSAAVPGEVRATGADALEARVDEPTSAVTPGQAIACYEGDRVIGGAWIDQAQLA